MYYSPGRCIWHCSRTDVSEPSPAFRCISTVSERARHWNAREATRDEHVKSNSTSTCVCLYDKIMKRTFSAFDRMHFTKYGSDWPNVSISLFKDTWITRDRSVNITAPRISLYDSIWSILFAQKKHSCDQIIATKCVIISVFNRIFYTYIYLHTSASMNNLSRISRWTARWCSAVSSSCVDEAVISWCGREASDSSNTSAISRPAGAEDTRKQTSDYCQMSKRKSSSACETVGWSYWVTHV